MPGPGWQGDIWSERATVWRQLRQAQLLSAHEPRAQTVPTANKYQQWVFTGESVMLISLTDVLTGSH